MPTLFTTEAKDVMTGAFWHGMPVMEPVSDRPQTVAEYENALRVLTQMWQSENIDNPCFR